MDLYKKEFNNGVLLLSKESYVELKARPEDQRSFKEFIQVKVYETVEKYQRELEILRRENDELSEESMVIKLRGDKVEREYEGLKKLSRDREEDSRRKTNALEIRAKELENDLHRMDSQHRVLMDKGITSKELDARYREMEIEFKTLQNKHTLLDD